MLNIAVFTICKCYDKTAENHKNLRKIAASDISCHSHEYEFDSQVATAGTHFSAFVTPSMH